MCFKSVVSYLFPKAMYVFTPAFMFRFSCIHGFIYNSYHNVMSVDAIPATFDRHLVCLDRSQYDKAWRRMINNVV